MGDYYFHEYFQYLEVQADELLVQGRLPKRYIRDMENPMEFYSNEEFRKRYRFRKEIVRNIIFPLVQNNLVVQSNRGLPVPPIIKLSICLRYYATGNLQIVTGDLRGISQSSVSRAIANISVLLAQNLENFIRFPANELGQRNNVTKFYEIAHFPSVAGCIDCTHIKISNPGGENGEVFRNRKGYFSLNVQVVSGPNLEIMDVVVRHPGSTHDSLIFDRSAVRVMTFELGQLHSLLLGDFGYVCRRYLLTPVVNPTTHQQGRYNRAHIRTRNVVERVFGVWKKRFRCLQSGLTLKLETSAAVICATAILHNIAMSVNEDEFLDEENEEIINEHNNIKDVGMGLAFRTAFINRHF